MGPIRRVALVFDPHRLDRHQRELLAGIRRFAERAPHWRCAFDPYAPYNLPGPYDGFLAAVGTRAAGFLQKTDAPVVFPTWRASTTKAAARAVENRWLGGRLAAEHLLARGYHSFAYFAIARDASRLERDGFGRWLRRRGLPVASFRLPNRYRFPTPHWERTQTDLERWLDELPQPVGIFVARDALASTLADLARWKGLDVPGDVGLIGAGNDTAVCELEAPPLSSIEYHYEQVGCRAAELLDRLMDGQPPPRGRVLIPPTLVARRSTARGYFNDPLVARTIAYIEAHSAEPIRAEHVVQATGFSHRQLTRRMKEGCGLTIVQEIVRARLDRARRLLETRGDSLADIARATGFPSRWAMTHAFRQHLATTPTAYRQRHRS